MFKQFFRRRKAPVSTLSPVVERPTFEATPVDAPLKRLKRFGKYAQAISAIIAVAAPLVMAALTFLTNHYLSAFGQSGLASLGQVAGFLTATLPVVLLIVGMLTGFCALPLLARWTTNQGLASDHAFSGAHGWLAHGQPQKLRALGVYACAHIAGLVAAVLLVVSFFEPKALDLFWWCPLLIGLVVLATAVIRRPPEQHAFDTPRAARTLLAFLYSNLVFISWTVLLAKVALYAITPFAREAPTFGAALIATLVVLALLGLHLLASALEMSTACGIAAIMATAVLCVAGDQMIIAMTLNVSRLGGGRPMVYRAKDGVLVQGCEVLATSDSRIVWLPDRAGEIKPVKALPAQAAIETWQTPCDWRRFRARLQSGASWSAQGDPAASDGVRIFKREDLYDKP